MLAADGISRVLVLLTGIAAVAGVLFSWNIELRTNEFFAFYLALIGGVYGVFLSFDLFLLFVFYEIAIVPKYFLIAIWGSTRREYAAMKLALYSFVGSAHGADRAAGGLCDVGQPLDGAGCAGARGPARRASRCGASRWCLSGFAILAGMWPFHTWAPTGHVAAPTAASMLLAGVVMKLGAYGCLRVAIGALSARARSVGILVARHRLVARRVCDAGGDRHCLRRAGGAGADRLQICHRLLEREPHGICAAGPDDAEPDRPDGRGAADVLARHHRRAALRHCGPHRLRPHAHAAVGRAGARCTSRKRLPFAAWAFVIAGMASMGLPGFSGFVAELQVLIGAWIAKPWWTAGGRRGHRGGRRVYVARAAEGVLQRCAAAARTCLKQEHAHQFAADHLAGDCGRGAAGGVRRWWSASIRGFCSTTIEPAVKALLAGGVQ